MMDPRDFVAPMLATTAPRPFDDAQWWYEVKWDGFRAIVSHVDRLRIYSRRGHDLLAQYPELATLSEVIPKPLVLDGELVALDNGRPSYARLKARAGDPYVVMVFDCLYSAAGWHLHEPWRERRARLEDVLTSRGQVVISQAVQGEGVRLWHAAAAEGLEGVMAKREDSRYVPGRRVRYWQKFLVHKTGRFWVAAIQKDSRGSWQWLVVDEKGDSNRIVARLPAPVHWEPGPMAAKDGVIRLLRPLPVEINYRERTREGYLRHASIRRWGPSASDSHLASPE